MINSVDQVAATTSSRFLPFSLASVPRRSVPSAAFRSLAQTVPDSEAPWCAWSPHGVGKKWFGFSKMEILTPNELVERINKG